MADGGFGFPAYQQSVQPMAGYYLSQLGQSIGQSAQNIVQEIRTNQRDQAFNDAVVQQAAQITNPDGTPMLTAEDLAKYQKMPLAAKSGFAHGLIADYATQHAQRQQALALQNAQTQTAIAHGTLLNARAEAYRRWIQSGGGYGGRPMTPGQQAVANRAAAGNINDMLEGALGDVEPNQLDQPTYGSFVNGTFQPYNPDTQPIRDYARLGPPKVGTKIAGTTQSGRPTLVPDPSTPDYSNVFSTDDVSRMQALRQRQQALLQPPGGVPGGGITVSPQDQQALIWARNPANQANPNYPAVVAGLRAKGLIQ